MILTGYDPLKTDPTPTSSSTLSKQNVTLVAWHVTPDTWHITHDMWHRVGDENSLKISALHLLRFGIVCHEYFEQKYSQMEWWRWMVKKNCQLSTNAWIKIYIVMCVFNILLFVKVLKRNRDIFLLCFIDFYRYKTVSIDHLVSIIVLLPVELILCYVKYCPLQTNAWI